MNGGTKPQRQFRGKNKEKSIFCVIFLGQL